jgi:RNA polymerase sigma-70 factor (ECF subfamily)
MHSARRHFSPGAEVTPWAFAIARRLLIDTLRKGGRECLVEDDHESEKQDSIPPDALPDAVVGRQRFADRMDRELARIPEAHRVAFELVQRDGLSMAETAQVLGTTVAAVKLRAFRTYEALREALGEEARELLEGMS